MNKITKNGKYNFMNKTNSVIFLKDIESNIIEEAVIVLKENVNINKLNNENEFNKGILNEAELIINERVKENDLEFQKYKITKLTKRIRILLITNILLIILLIILFLS